MLNERDILFEGHRVRVFEGGTGFPILLLHGTGPGTSTVGNFARILEPLAERYHVFAADLVGFGKSGRKSAQPYFDYPLWRRQAQCLLDQLPEGPLGVFGHSLSGALALDLAAENSRVVKVMTSGSIGTPFKVNTALNTTWTFPETVDHLRTAILTLVYDGSAVTDSFLADRMAVLGADGYASYFRTMFGGDKQRLVDSAVVSDARLSAIQADVFMLHGREDRPVPAADTSLVLGRKIANCDVALIGRCGHSPALEHPGKVLRMASMIFG